MRARNVVRNGQAQAHTASLEIAPLIQPREWAEGFFTALFGNARAVIINRNFRAARRLT